MQFIYKLVKLVLSLPELLQAKKSTELLSLSSFVLIAGTLKLLDEILVSRGI